MRPLPSAPGPHARRAPAVPGRPPAWQRRFLRHRRLIAALLAGVVVWSLGAALRPAGAPTGRALIARHDLRPGDRIAADDLDVTVIPVDRAPSDAVTSLDSVVGRAVASVVRTGEAVRERDVVAAPLLGALGTGLVATAVRLSDPAATGLVRAGDVIDVVAATPGDVTARGSAAVVATRVRVLEVPTSASAPGIFSSGDSTGGAGPGSVVVLATTTAQALDLARASVGARLSLVLRAG